MKATAAPTARRACRASSPRCLPSRPWPEPYRPRNSARYCVRAERLRNINRMVSAPLAWSEIPSGTSFSSFASSFVSSGKSAFRETSIPRFERMLLQHVSTSSFAVPIARAGSHSTAFSSRSISFCIQPASNASATVRARDTDRLPPTCSRWATNRGRPAIFSSSTRFHPSPRS